MKTTNVKDSASAAYTNLRGTGVNILLVGNTEDGKRIGMQGNLNIEDAKVLLEDLIRAVALAEERENR